MNIITHHALRRYAERMCGVIIPRNLSDIDAIEYLQAAGVNTVRVAARLARELGPAVTMGASKVSIDGLTAIIQDRKVLTFVPGSSPSSAHNKSRLATGKAMTGRRRKQRNKTRKGAEVRW